MKLSSSHSLVCAPHSINSGQSILSSVRTWLLILPFLYFGGVAWTSSQDRAHGDMIVSTGPEHFLTRIAWIVAYGLLALAIGGSFRVMLDGARRNMWIVLLSIYVILSSAWSVVPSESLKMGVFFALTTVTSLWLSEAFSWRWQMQMLMIVGVILAVASIVMALFFPSIGLDTQQVTAWQGVFYSKNHCGRIMLFLLTPVFYYPWGKTVFGIVKATCYFTLLAFVILMSQSRSAWFLGAIYICAMPILNQMRRLTTRQLKAAFAIGSPLVFAGSISLALLIKSILSATGRDLTFSGRTTIWHYVMESIALRPFFGYGYSGFWHSGQGFYVFMAVKSMMSFMGSYAHNGFLDILLQLGFVGLLILLYAVSRALWTYWRIPKHDRNAGSRWYAGVILLSLAYNMDEVTFGVQNHLPWMMFIIACAGLAGIKSLTGLNSKNTRAVSVPSNRGVRTRELVFRT